MPVHSSKTVRLLHLAPKGRFSIRMSFVTKVANWRWVPCFGAMEMGWFVSGEID